MINSEIATSSTNTITQIGQVDFRSYKHIDHLSLVLHPQFNLLLGATGSGGSDLCQLLRDALLFQSGKYRGLEVSVGMRSSLDKKYIWQLDIEDSASRWQRLNKLQYKVFLSQDGKTILHDTDSLDAIRTNDSINKAMNIFALTGLINAGNFFQIGDLMLSLPLLKTPDRIIFERNKKVQHFISESTPKFIRIITQNLIDQIISKPENDEPNTVSELIDHFFPEEFITSLKTHSAINGVRFKNGHNVYLRKSELVLSNLQLEFNYRGQWQLWDDLPLGLQRIFQIYCEVFLQKAGVFIIDQPEIGLDHKQLSGLLSLIRSCFNTQSQFIIHSHSPFVLESLKQNELASVINSQFNDGVSSFVKLNETDKERLMPYFRDDKTLDLTKCIREVNKLFF